METTTRKASALGSEITPDVLKDMGDRGRKELLLRCALVFERADVASPFANWSLVEHMLLTDDELESLPEEERKQKVCGVLRVLGATTKMDAQEAAQSEMRKRGIIPGEDDESAEPAPPKEETREELKARLRAKLRGGEHSRKAKMTKGQARQKQEEVLERLNKAGLNAEIVTGTPDGVDPDSKAPVRVKDDQDDERTKKVKEDFDKLSATEKATLMGDLHQMGLVRRA